MAKSTLSRCLLIILALALASCSGRNASSSTISIAVIPKGTTHVFWQSIRAGAERAGKELNVDIVWRGPLREDDRDAQVSEVENAVSRGVSGICIAPLDESALVQPIQEAQQKKIPVVI